MILYYTHTSGYNSKQTDPSRTNYFYNFYLLGVLLSRASRSDKYFGELTIIMSSCRMVNGFNSLFRYSCHGMLGNFCCRSAIFIGLYSLAASRRSSSGSDIFANPISKSNDSLSSLVALCRSAPNSTAMSTMYL